MKTILDKFEEMNQKDNQRNMKFLIQLKIAQENTDNDLKLFKNNIQKTTQKLQSESEKYKLNKSNVEANLRSILDTFDKKVLILTQQINKLNTDQANIKNPLTEYCDVLKRENEHLTNQNKINKEQIDSMLSEFKGINSSISNLKSQPSDLKKYNYNNK